MLIYSFITDYQAFNLRYKDNTTRDKNETKVDKQSANLGKNNEPIQNRLSFLIDCKSVILHHLAILSFPMVRPAWDNWWLLMDDQGNRLVFDSLLEALNYLSARGWELAEVYPEVDDGDSSACYLMRKKLCDFTLQEREIYDSYVRR